MFNQLVLLFFTILFFYKSSLYASKAQEVSPCEIVINHPSEAATHYSDLLIQSRQSDNESMKSHQMYLLEQFILSEFKSEYYTREGQTLVSSSGFKAQKLNSHLGPEQVKAYLVDRFFRFYLVPLTFKLTINKEIQYFQIQLMDASFYNANISKEGVFYPDINLALAFAHLTRQDLFSTSLTQSERVMSKPYNSIGKDRLFVVLNRLFDPHVFSLDDFFKVHPKEKKYVREDDILGPIEWSGIFKHYPLVIHRILEVRDEKVRHSLEQHLHESEISKLLKFRSELVLAFKAYEKTNYE